MSKKQDKRLIAGMDIGTSKIVTLVGEITPEGAVEIIGLGTHPSRGLKKGVVVNIESTVASMQRAVEEAELMAGCQIHSVYAGIAGSHIRSINSNGIVAIRDREVTQADVDRVLDAAKAVAIPMDQRIVHVLPQEFVIDEQEGIRQPVGMSGVRLEARVHIVTAAVSAMQNIVKCVRRCGLEVDELVLEQVASSHSVLTDDEMELGVCLVDIGGGTTDIAVFVDGSIKHTSVLSIGGYHLSNDVAVGLRTPFDEAERIKKRFGVASARFLGSDDIITVPSVGGRRPREVSRKVLCEIIEPRMEEILGLAQQEIVKSGLDARIPSGVVLTGGCAALAGMTDLAEEIFESPVRLGMPANIGGLQDVVRDPMYATGVGLILFGYSQAKGKSTSRFRIRDEGIFRRVKQRMRDWFYADLE